MTERIRFPKDDEEYQNVIAALAVLPTCRAVLIKQLASDGTDITDTPIGTVYKAWPTVQKQLLFANTKSEPVVRDCIWVKREGDPPMYPGGLMPIELFRVEYEPWVDVKQPA